jgi:membrane-associated protease RseP (regulator of RpoE activity)
MSRLIGTASLLLLGLQQPAPEAEPRNDAPAEATLRARGFLPQRLAGQPSLYFPQATANQVQGVKLLTEDVTPQGVNLVYELIGGQDDGLGMTLANLDPALRAQLKLPDGQGILVSAVAPGGPADRVGIKPNDILLALWGKPLAEPGDLTKRLKDAAAKPGPLTLIRSGKGMDIQVTAHTRVTLAPVEPEAPSFYLGVQTTPADATLRAHLDLPGDTGLVVNEVVEDTPAEKAGVKAGDILLKLGNHPLPDTETLSAMIQATGGKPAKLTLLRGGQSQDVEFTPQPRPKAETTRAEAVYHLGVAPQGQAFWAGSPDQPNSSRWVAGFQPYMSWRAGDTMPRAMEGDRLEALGKQVEELRKAVEELKDALKK